MSEIAKLRQRLSNVNKRVTEYRMTVDEAKALLKEIDTVTEEQKQEPPQVVVNEPAIITRIMDGGAFE